MKIILFQQLKTYPSLREIGTDAVCVVDSDGTARTLQSQGNNLFDKDLIKKIALFAVQEQTISASTIQRTFRIGYARAHNILDYMESIGYISAASETEPRKVLITKEQIQKDFS